MADELEINKGGVVSLIDNHELGEILKPLVREIYLFNSYVAGTTHLEDQSVLGEIKEEDDLLLQREDNRMRFWFLRTRGENWGIFRKKIM